MGYYSHSTHKYYPGKKEKIFLWIFSILCIIGIPTLAYYAYVDYKSTEDNNYNAKAYGEYMKQKERESYVEDSIRRHIKDSLEVDEFNKKLEKIKQERMR